MENNIDDFIEAKIDNILKEKNIYHIGKVVKINEFVVETIGLDDAFFFEKVYVGNEENIGYVDKIEENKVIIALVKTNGKIKIGDLVKTTGQALESNFSKNALGMIIDAFGTDRISGKNFNDSKTISIETPKIPIMDRTAVNRPLETGIAGIDLMFPIGKGQRQLIIGDKKTGKTQILLDAIVNQKNKNVICIYVSVGKTKKEIKRLYTKLIEKNANAYTLIVAAFNDDTSPMIKLTPYVALSIAEEYLKEGKDVLVCIDDLKKHAEACREIALISEKNTGREAYPADIFYTHSRLLEKGCQYKNGGSITILPVVETKGGDITDYISTNIISITDGQIVLNEKTFKKGQKPAIDFGLSVSRLGGAVQRESIKKIGARVRQELLSYLETADVYQLVKIDSMTKELQEKMHRGKKILELLNQPKFSPRSEEKLVEYFSFINDEDKNTSNQEELHKIDEPTDSNENNKGPKLPKVEEQTEIKEEKQNQEEQPKVEEPTDLNENNKEIELPKVEKQTEIKEEKQNQEELLKVEETTESKESNEKIELPKVEKQTEIKEEKQNQEELLKVEEPNDSKESNEKIELPKVEEQTEIKEEKQNQEEQPKVEEPTELKENNKEVKLPKAEKTTEIKEEKELDIDEIIELLSQASKDTIVDDINEEKNEEKTMDIDEIIRLLQEEQNKPNQTLNKNDDKNDSKRKKHSENKDGE